MFVVAVVVVFISLVLLTASCSFVNLSQSNVKDLFDNYPGYGNLNLLLTEDILLNINITAQLQENDEIIITGENHFITCQAENVNVKINGSSNSKLLLRGVTFKNCGPHVAAVVLVNNINVEVENCTFENNKCAGFNARDSNVTITNSTFRNNSAQNVTKYFKDEFKFGKTNLAGGIGILFDNATNHNVVIKNCLVEKNSAFVNDTEFVNTHATSNKKNNVSNYFTIGGGISILHLFNTNGNQLSITDCIIKENTATYAGGIFVTFAHSSNNNKVYLSHLLIKKNFVPQTGGGFICSNWDNADENTFEMYDTVVSENRAMTGGGGKLIQNNKHLTHTYQAGIIRYKIVRTNITHNNAKSASALRLLFKLPIGFAAPVLPIFKDCRIENNFPLNNSKEHLGAIISSRFSFVLDGNTTFKDNTHGSAIYLSNAEIHVKGNIRFVKNHGKYGGAIHVADVSRIIVYDKSVLHFEENIADIQGGALNVESSNYVETMYPFNPSCFLLHENRKKKPSEWKVKIKFIGNSASERGAAIYISTLLHCQWHEDEKLGFQSFAFALNWTDNVFEYKNNYLDRDAFSGKRIYNDVDIATDTYTIDVLSLKKIKVSPGEPFNLHLTASDQLNHLVYSSPLVKHISRKTFGNDTEDNVLFLQHVFLAPDNSSTELSVVLPNASSYDHLVDGVKHFLEISDVTSAFKVKVFVDVEIVKCNPGFIFNGKICICDVNVDGVLGCAGGRYVYLKKGYWGGVVNGNFVTHICPRGYCKCENEGLFKQSCVFDYRNPHDICRTGRWNVLCGQCQHGLSVGLRSSDCRDCSNTGYLLLVPILIVITISILVIYFNPGISTELRGILFYLQVLPYIFQPNDEVGDWVNMISGIIDLGGPSDYPINTCAAPGFGNLEKVALNYMTPVIVLLIFIVVYKFHGRLRWTNIGKPFQRFFVLFVFVFKYLVETSLLSLHCVDVGGKTVFYKDGSLECYTGSHLILSIIAVFVLVLLVVPPILFIPLIVMGYWPTNCVGDEHILKTTFTDGYRRRDSVVTDCYHSGERGWWWSIDLLRRFILIAFFVYIEDIKIKQIVITFLCLCFLIVHCVNRPYNDGEENHANLIESWFLFALTALSNIQTIHDDNLRYVTTVFLLIATYGFAVFWFLHTLYRCYTAPIDEPICVQPTFPARHCINESFELKS